MQSEIYFDLCDNIKTFLRIEQITNKKTCKPIKKLKYVIYTKLKLINELKQYNEYILYTKNPKKSIKKIEKIFYYLNQKGYKIIVSDYFIKTLKDTNSYIINKVIQYNKNDKTTFNEKILETINFVMDIKKEKEQENNIYIILKEYNETMKNTLEYFIKTYKSINIITEQLKEYKTLEENIYSKYEIPIIISNNKRKALARAKYIINVNLNESQINQYTINRDAIIFNLSSNTIKKIRGFEGIIINNIEVTKKAKKMDEKNYLLNRFTKNIKGTKICNLLGNNGRINPKEFEKNIY